MARIRLRPDVVIRLTNRDHTFFGSPIGTQPDDNTRQLFAPVIKQVRAASSEDLPRVSARALAKVVRGESFGEIADRDGGDRWRVRPEVLYPDPDLAGPDLLSISRPGTPHFMKLKVPNGLWPAVHDLLAELCCDRGRLYASGAAESGDIFAGMIEQQLVEYCDDGSSSAASQSDILFAGHNTVLVQSSMTRVLIDPFLFAHHPMFPASYQPFTAPEFGAIDAIALTHSHPDHFDPASLLRFRRDTRIIVPAVERETLLSVDMVRRVTELGFESVTPLVWGEWVRVGDIEIAALPFYGEQPAEDDVMHPEIRNAGNTYVVRTPSVSAAFVADSGRDPSGDVRAVARDWRAREGPVDFVFSGYRGWTIYPAQLLFSSVSRYLFFVPPSLWETRQRLMNGVDEAIDVAEHWGARFLVPYADGGAPWYWEAGLGPRLDGTGQENTTFDPFPERVLEAAQRRGQTGSGSVVSSPVEVLLLRPGDSVTLDADGRRVDRTPGHEWPYDVGVEARDGRLTFPG